MLTTKHQLEREGRPCCLLSEASSVFHLPQGKRSFSWGKVWDAHSACAHAMTQACMLAPASCPDWSIRCVQLPQAPPLSAQPWFILLCALFLHTPTIWLPTFQFCAQPLNEAFQAILWKLFDLLAPSPPLPYFGFLHGSYQSWHIIYLLLYSLTNTRPDCRIGFGRMLIFQGLTQCLPHKQGWTFVE